MASFEGKTDAYQLLRQKADGFSNVIPDREFIFPNDHYPHESFKIEWWYFTANLADEAGNEYGVHWTLFRQAMDALPNQGGWQSNQTWMAHTAISTPDSFTFAERFARGGVGQAGVQYAGNQSRFEAWIDDWTWIGQTHSPFPGTLSASAEDKHFVLDLSASERWILQGESGFSQKSQFGQASYYYSQPFVNVTGRLWKGGKSVSISGKGWLDREWSSQPLADDQPGWDWISLHLHDGSALMVYRLRHRDTAPFLSGTWVDSTGFKVSLKPEDITLVPLRFDTIAAGSEEKALPLAWSLVIPGLAIDLIVSAVRQDSWLDTAFPYWEGPVAVTGSQTGLGYLELTGY